VLSRALEKLLSLLALKHYPNSFWAINGPAIPMPIFDYSCQACGHTFDILQKLGADPLTECPECGQAELKKLMSAPAFHLKGKGWRNSDDAPKKFDVRPKFTHTLDSPVAHAEHAHDGPASKGGDAHDHGGSHSHDNAETGGGLGKIARQHVEGHSHGHSHAHDSDKPKKSSDKKSGGHGHSHGHKHDH
jgi:putative FmdB family regulatory protein